MTIARSLRSSELANRDSRMLLQAQIPFLGATAGIAVFLAIANRTALARPDSIFAVALAVAMTLCSLFVPWGRLSQRWLILVAVLDILSVAILRDATAGALQGVGIIVVFPVLFLAYSFSSRVLVVVVLGSLFLVAYPYIRAQRLPENAADWGNVIVVPITVCFIALSAHIAARQFRRQGRRLSTTQASTDAVLAALNSAILVIDPDDHVILINDPARAVLGRAGASAASTLTDELQIFEEDGVTNAGFRKGAFGASLRDHDLSDRLLVVGKPGDERLSYSVTSRSVVHKSGRLVGTVVVAHDVSEFVDAARDRDLFLQTISHEFRTPLTSIIGYLEVIEDTVDVNATGVSHELDVITRNAFRLHALVDALLTVAAAPKPFTVSLVQIGQVVTDALSASQLAAHRGRVEIRHEQIPSVTAECDPARVRQVVDNLISNAIKYTPAGGTVTVSLAHDDDDAVFTVSDSGFGITDDEKPLVFDRFFRGRIAQEQAVQGVGIGLTIVKEAAEAHGGTVAIDSTVGTGTTVTVRLPLRVAA